MRGRDPEEGNSLWREISWVMGRQIPWGRRMEMPWRGRCPREEIPWGRRYPGSLGNEIKEMVHWGGRHLWREALASGKSAI